MSDEFNFEITTKYKPEFKEQTTNANLYRMLVEEILKRDNKKKEKHIDYTGRMKDAVSAIKEKMRNQLHLDIDVYASKSDEERYNTLKLLHFIVGGRQYEGEGCDKKLSLSVLNLLIKPSMEHTDAKNAMHGKNFSNIVKQYRPAVSKPEYREETINGIHSLWENVRANITNLLIVETAMQQGDYNSIEARIKGIYLNINKDYINSLQRTDDGIIDTFYNMLLSSHVIAEIEDMKKCVYDYSNEETVPQEITDLFMDELFNVSSISNVIPKLQFSIIKNKK